MRCFDLSRYIDAHQRSFSQALTEIKNGHKESHWMWYIFPQIDGLGHSATSKYYSIKNLEEAREFIAHPYLGVNLREICRALLLLETSNATMIFGNPDDKKLKSCMTLFSYATDDNQIFLDVLRRFFEGKKDNRTIQLLEKS